MDAQQTMYLRLLDYRQVEGFYELNDVFGKGNIQDILDFAESFRLKEFFLCNARQEDLTRQDILKLIESGIETLEQYGRTVLTPYKDQLDLLASHDIETLRLVTQLTPSHEFSIIAQKVQLMMPMLTDVFFYHSCGPFITLGLKSFCRDVLVYIKSDEYKGKRQRQLSFKSTLHSKEEYTFKVYKEMENLTKIRQIFLSFQFQRIIFPESATSGEKTTYAITCKGTPSIKLTKTFATESLALTDFMQIMVMKMVDIDKLLEMGFTHR